MKPNEMTPEKLSSARYIDFVKHQTTSQNNVVFFNHLDNAPDNINKSPGEV